MRKMAGEKLVQLTETAKAERVIARYLMENGKKTIDKTAPAGAHRFHPATYYDFQCRSSFTGERRIDLTFYDRENNGIEEPHPKSALTISLHPLKYHKEYNESGLMTISLGLSGEHYQVHLFQIKERYPDGHTECFVPSDSEGPLTITHITDREKFDDKFFFDLNQAMYEKFLFNIRDIIVGKHDLKVEMDPMGIFT